MLFSSKSANILYIMLIEVVEMTFSEKVLELRGRIQITQRQLAELLGVSFTTVNRWEKGHYEATILVRRRFDDLCKKHGIIFDENGVAE